MAKKQHPQRGSPSYVQWQKQLADKKNLNAEEAACYLGVSIQTLYKLTSRKAFSFTKPGGKLITVKRDDLDEWQKSYTFKPSEQIKQKILNKYLL